MEEDYSCELCNEPNHPQMIQCFRCELWFHWECVGVDQYVDEDWWLCDSCKSNTESETSDTTSNESMKNEQQSDSSGRQAVQITIEHLSTRHSSRPVYCHSVCRHSNNNVSTGQFETSRNPSLVNGQNSNQMNQKPEEVDLQMSQKPIRIDRTMSKFPETSQRLFQRRMEHRGIERLDHRETIHQSMTREIYDVPFPWNKMSQHVNVRQPASTGKLINKFRRIYFVPNHNEVQCKSNGRHITSWSKWIHLLPKVEELRLARLYSTKLSPGVPTSIELHTFVDASEHAYSAVTFIRVEDATGVDCSLIGSKTRVAPMKYLSIPRLELQGGILGTRLLSSIGEAQRFNVIRRVIWTDSFTLLSWIRSDQRKYHQFVAHRIGEILESTDQTEWRWIPSKLNVADDATKWTKDINFKSSNRWYKGPEFLKLSEEHWPQQPSEIQPDTTEEIKFHFVHLELHVPTLVNSANFSNWNRMIRALAYARRYIFILRAKIQKKVVQHTPFSREELIFARNLLIRQAQFECYPRAKVLETIVGSNGQVRRAKIQKGDKNKTILWRSAQNLARLDVHEKQSMDSLATDPMSNQTGRSVMNGNTSQDIELNEGNADSGQRMSKRISENNLTTNGDSTFE